MENKTVLITGGNKGIGLELTEMFIADGANVIVAARDFSNFKYNQHPQVRTETYDFTNVAGIPDFIENLPAIDVLINNAGVMFATPYDEYTAEDVDRVLKINIEAPVALINYRSVQINERQQVRSDRQQRIHCRTDRPS